MRNPQTQTSLGWKPFTAKAYRNILVFYKPLAPSTRAGRLIRPEGLADVLLTALGFCLPLCPAAVCPEAVRHQPRKGYSWLRMIVPKHNSRTQIMGKLVFRKTSHSRRATGRLVKGKPSKPYSVGQWSTAHPCCLSPPSSQCSSYQAQAHPHGALGNVCTPLQPHQFLQQGEEEKLLSSPGSLSCSVLCLLHAGLFHRHLKSLLPVVGPYWAHFTDEETEAHGGIKCPSELSWTIADPGFKHVPG